MEDITKSCVAKPAISLEVHLMAGLEELETVAIVETLSSAQRAEEINADNDRNIDGEYRDHLPLHHPYLMYDFVFFFRNDTMFEIILSTVVTHFY